MYQNKPLRTTGASISGRNIAHTSRSGTESALLGADIALGRLQPTDLTIKQIAQLLKISAAYVHDAIQVAMFPTLRHQVDTGQIPLFEAAKQARQARSRVSVPDWAKPEWAKPAPSLFDMFAAATPNEQARCMRFYTRQQPQAGRPSTSEGSTIVRPAQSDQHAN